VHSSGSNFCFLTIFVSFVFFSLKICTVFINAVGQTEEEEEEEDCNQEEIGDDPQDRINDGGQKELSFK